ncbi:MAG: PEGA domain-containing protein [Methanoregula sp.]|nr:PEGA domain-containing protein [Methanoregula sp.]
MRINKFISVLVLLIAAICIIQPVLGANGTVSIAYRGSGGSYIGDTIIFDGKNTVGNITFIRITGPGLPVEGVPIYDLNGNPGAGNPVEVNPDGTWKLAWYSSTVKGIEKMQTARYYFIAADLAHPESSSTTSVLMKKAEFYADLTPNPATNADYVSLTGSAERGVSYVRIDVTDISGKTLRTYSSPVSASGYFNYGFHVDMQPGQYYITVSNPSIKNPLQMVLTVLPPRTQTPMGTTVTVTPGGSTASIPDSITPSATTPQNPQGIPAGTGTLSISSTPAGSSVYLDSVMMGKTPVDLGNLNYGSHLVEIKSPGYQTYSVQVTVQDGTPVTLSPVLLKSPSSIPLSPVTAIIGLFITCAIALVWKRT